MFQDLLELLNVQSIRILIVDDHELVRRGIRALLTSRPDFDVCAEASDGVQGVDKAIELRPDIVLMDITMPNKNGLDATRLIRSTLPNTEVILVSQNESSVVQRQAVEVDARAFVAKSNIANDLIPAIDRVTPRWNRSAPCRRDFLGQDYARKGLHGCRCHLRIRNRGSRAGRSSRQKRQHAAQGAD